MVGYPESVTDPSYRGQLLCITFPLVGNYGWWAPCYSHRTDSSLFIGVPSREAQDDFLESLPAYFEANEIHIAALIAASYAGEDYSHYLAKSSLGSWLKEQGVPAIYGVDTRALTKKIREQGSMLGRLMLQKQGITVTVRERIAGAANSSAGSESPSGGWYDGCETVEWMDPNKKNLVAEGTLVAVPNNNDRSKLTNNFKCRYGNLEYTHPPRIPQSRGRMERLRASSWWTLV